MSRPEIKQIEKIDFPSYEKIALSNNIEVSMLKAPSPDIIKMDIVLDAGRYYEKAKAVAKTTANLINDGTRTMTSKQIAEKIDYYGATLNMGANMDTAEIHLYCLSKYFDRLLPLVRDILTLATFPEDELEKYKKRNIEKLNIELSKNEVLSYRYFTEKLFGFDHPYGYNTEVEDYQNIRREQLLSHYNEYYGAGNMKIFITGNLDDQKLRILDTYLGSLNKNASKTAFDIKYDKNTGTGQYVFEGKGEYQAAIKIGRPMFTREHPDYPAMYVLNTIVGGYFGSRLNANIRESKGFTYGIYSSLDMMRHDGYFMIATEVGRQYTQDTLAEIYKELEVLQNEPVSEDELQLVKNYIKGNFLSMINGHINTIRLIKTIETAGLGKDFFNTFIEKIDSITPARLLEAAKKYFAFDSLTGVLVTPQKKTFPLP